MTLEERECRRAGMTLAEGSECVQKRVLFFVYGIDEVIVIVEEGLFAGYGGDFRTGVHQFIRENYLNILTIHTLISFMIHKKISVGIIFQQLYGFGSAEIRQPINLFGR
jgi:hypothetical protein